MYINYVDGLGQAAAAVTVSSADSRLVKDVTPADPCGVSRTGGNLDVRGWPNITHVVIHTLIGPAAPAIIRWHDGDSCVPPHYVIKKNGEITQMVAEYHNAQHAGAANKYSIGIEHEGGCYDSPACFSESLYQASSALVRDICDRQRIPKDREHIIGHDEAPGTGHGDPGGYWDWDYYMALLQWDGSTAGQKPQRIVLDYNSLFTFPQTGSWKERTRKWMRWGPNHGHSYAGKYYYAEADAAAPDDDVVQYEATIPDGGRWSLSAWWPVLQGNNRAAHIAVATNNGDPAQRSFSADYDQSDAKLMARRTVALPSTHTWMAVHTFMLNAGDSVSIRVSRRSSKRGQVIADAFRLLKT